MTSVDFYLDHHDEDPPAEHCSEIPTATSYFLLFDLPRSHPN